MMGDLSSDVVVRSPRNVQDDAHPILIFAPSPQPPHHGAQLPHLWFGDRILCGDCHWHDWQLHLRRGGRRLVGVVGGSGGGGWHSGLASGGLVWGNEARLSSEGGFAWVVSKCLYAHTLLSGYPVWFFSLRSLPRFPVYSTIFSKEINMAPQASPASSPLAAPPSSPSSPSSPPSSP